jgi:hypothetical protein
MDPILLLEYLDYIILYPTIKLHNFLHYIYGRYIEIFKIN